IKHFDHDAAPLPLRTAGLLGHLAVISPEQIVTLESRSPTRLASLRAPGRTGARATLGLTRPMPCRPRGRQPPTVSLGRNHDFEGIECEVDHTLCAEWECGTHLHVRLILRVSPLPTLTDQDIRQRG